MRLHNEPEWILPFQYMEIGESFFIPTLKTSPLIYAIDSGAKRAKVKVKSFVTIKDNCLGVRVWRIK
ncbi:hypothetical protein N9F47_03990 [Gammaproteobacteria bacterium]|jgi:hypothetical protein|nr:hypothetical protein [Gammaproteobacteria bacterium]|tara:strand:+ start:1268 stop:1468 length:201 start_codon:yes stop_codon:yes gene_type:complete